MKNSLSRIITVSEISVFFLFSLTIMKKSRLLIIIGLCIIAPLVFYMWVLIRAHDQLGGSQPPNRQILGRALTDGQRAMEQSCTGVVATKQGVWLVGSDFEGDDRALPRSALNLDALLPAGSTPDTGTDFGDNETSQISRLGNDGVFHTVAYISGDACLLPSADKTGLLLLTGAQPPENNEGQQAQTVVFRADDQGKNWRILQGGFMADAESLAWSLRPYFHGSHEVWAEGQGKFFYSSDQGAHAHAVEGTDQLWEAPPGMPPVASSGNTVVAHIVQFSDQQATAWVSQSYWAGDLQTFTREARLTRDDGHWKVGDIHTTPGIFLYEVKDNGAGRVIAELRRSNDDAELAELGQDGYSWNKLSDLPNLFWPFPASTMIRSNQQTNFYVSGPVILMTVTSTHKIILPSFRSGGEPAEIDGNGVFFSNDNGSHWKQLAIPGFLGVLGFNANSKQVYWNKGNWYENDDRNIYASDLSR